MNHLIPTSYWPETLPPVGRSQLARCPSPLFKQTLTLQQLPTCLLLRLHSSHLTAFSLISVLEMTYGAQGERPIPDP